MKTGFLFLLQIDLLVGQLCTNPKSDRSLLSCLKWHNVQRAISEMRRCTTLALLQIQVMTTWPLQAPSKCKSGRFNAWGHSSTHRMTLRAATVIVFSVVSSGGHIMPTHIFEACLKVNTKVYLNVAEECGDPLVQSGGRWQTLGVAAGLGAGPQVQRDPGLASIGVLRLCTLL